MEESTKKFLAILQEDQDNLAAGRDALLRTRTKLEKALAHNSYEMGLVVAGMHIHAAVVARGLEAAFGAK